MYLPVVISIPAKEKDLSSRLFLQYFYMYDWVIAVESSNNSVYEWFPQIFSLVSSVLCVETYYFGFKSLGGYMWSMELRLFQVVPLGQMYSIHKSDSLTFFCTDIILHNRTIYKTDRRVMI